MTSPRPFVAARAEADPRRAAPDADLRSGGTRGAVAFADHDAMGADSRSGGLPIVVLQQFAQQLAANNRAFDDFLGRFLLAEAAQPRVAYALVRPFLIVIGYYSLIMCRKCASPKMMKCSRHSCRTDCTQRST